MPNLTYRVGANLISVLDGHKKDDLKQQLVSITKEAKIPETEFSLTTLFSHQFATNQKPKEIANLFPLPYIAGKYHTTTDPIVRSEYLARIKELLVLLAAENKKDWQADVAFPDIVTFALTNKLPREFLLTILPFIPEHHKFGLLKEVLAENPTAVCVFFEAVHDKLVLEEYIELVGLAIKSNHFSVINGLLNKELLNQVDLSIRKKWAELILVQENTDHALFVKKLLDSGVNLEPTWLNTAIIRRKPHIAALLLKEKANPNFPDESGKTAAHCAAATGQLSFFTLLNYYGADFTIPDLDGRLPEQLTEDAAIKERLKSLTQPLVASEPEPENTTTIKYTKLAIRGGGVKGTAYPYAIKEAAQKGLFKLDDLDGVAGASAGAITAALIALGYNEDELEQIMGNLNLLDFVDPIDASFNQQKDALQRLIANFSGGIASGALWTALSPGDVSKAKALIDTVTTHKGIMKGDIFLDWIRARIKDKIKDSKLSAFLQEHPELVTFQDLADAGFKDLRVVATDVNRAHAVWFSAKETPHAIVADAIRASMSFPIAFRPHKYYIRVDKDGEFTREVHPDYTDVDLIDGGVMDNYPVRAFDKDMSSKQQTYNPNVIGLYLATPDEKLEFERGIKAAAKKIDGGFGYFSALIGSLLYHQEHTHLESTDSERTIYINTRDVGAMDFDASQEKLFQLAQEGRQGIHDFLNRRCGHHPLQALSPTTLQLLIEFGGAKIQRVEPHRIAIHLSQLLLRPEQIIRLYANCTDTELLHLRTLVNPNNSRDENGNSALHLAYAICDKLQAHLRSASTVTEQKQIKAHLSKAMKLRDNLLSINANARAKNNAGKTPEEMTADDLLEADGRDFLTTADKIAVEQLQIKLESAEARSKLFSQASLKFSAEISELSAKLKMKEEETKRLLEHNEQQASKISQHEQEIRENLKFYTKNIEEAKQQIALHREMLSQTKEGYDQLATQLQKREEELEELQRQHKLLYEEHTKLQQLRKEQEKQFFALTQLHQTLELELAKLHELQAARDKELATLRLEYESQGRELSRVHKLQEARDQELSSLRLKHESVGAELTQVRRLHEACTEELSQLQLGYKAKEEELSTLHLQFATQETELSELRQQHTALGEERDELRRQLADKEGDNQELRRQVDNKDLQITELRARLRAQIRTQQHGFFKSALDTLREHTDTLAQEKESFFSMNHERKDGKRIAIGRLVQKIADESNSNKTLAELIEESDTEHVLRAGFFSRRTSGMLDHLIEAENREMLELS
ncbi:patatin-like phospholipase family protein [Legionella micdadei]|uniref:patatin-like phospholipase family protein n=1 Tax=Legionella micdadei TaxID=451 RepID=UPI0009EF6FE4|nr:patatin-like phospholipase family protein [Legionella micdadei]ARG99450.1 hypothetical protein B6V88_02885 [Legionella micdadei]